MKLEDEISRFFNGWTDGYEFSQALNAEGECVTTSEIKDIARHFAEWQKEQIMKNAVNATVHLEPGANPIVTIGVGRFGLKVRDKVRIVIIKEDQGPQSA